MLFNSLQFLLFLPVVVALYFATPHRFRWALLLLASYYFYAAWRPEYLLLIIASTLVDYLCALRMGRLESRRRRKKYLVLSLGSNLGLLFGFKYLTFFNESTRAVFDQLNIFYGVPTFEILLPVGISFYTFQTLSYTIDVYRGARPPERHLGIFALYVSFFPQLVAGPIERSTRLLPQFFQHHGFDAGRVQSGLRLILWGFFKKIVIADRLAVYVNAVYANPSAYDGPSLLLATYFFAFQIYCDFSAYSDIAIGSARVMGFELMQNFRRPYFARSIQEFWQRWHISLSTWFRDYVYLPLGGNRVPTWRWYTNLLLVFLVSGLWHGANWTFVVWGALHGTYLVFAIATRDRRDHMWRRLEQLLPRWPSPLEPAPTLQVAATGPVGSAVPPPAPLLSSAAPDARMGWLGRARAAAWVRRGAFWRQDTTASPAAMLRNVVAVFTTFHLVLLAWIFFRAPSLAEAKIVLRGFFRWEGLSREIVTPLGTYELMLALMSVLLLIAAQAIQSRWPAQEILKRTPLPVRWAAYYALIFAILMFGRFEGTAFIYFQF